MTDKALQHLIKGCINEDRSSQKTLYKAFYGFAMAICLRYANNRDEAASIMNEGFFKVFTNLDRYDMKKPFKPWLGKIMTNTSIDYYRAHIRANRMEDLERAGDLSEEAAVMGKLAYEDILAMIHRLSPAYRAVFNLYVIDGYNHNEISEILGISVGTSKSNLHKARQKLQDMINEVTQSPDDSEYGFKKNVK